MVVVGQLAVLVSKQAYVMLNDILLQSNLAHFDEPTIIHLNHIMDNAIQKSASDIHFEPYENHCRIRLRCDGILYETCQLNNEFTARLITRLKIMARLDISERRLPQDGRFHIKKNNHDLIDIRINTCPTLFGEKVVLRILDTHKISLAIDTLGFTEPQKELFLNKISKPQGMILVAGPTGSGKTVTLYSALHYLNTLQKNIVTIEDPIEIQLYGINQVNINPKIGLSFSTLLRTLLRQDPDIIMVGEIRDKETAEIAIQAAQTGHLVFSTIHTNHAIEVFARLQAMGIAYTNIIQSLSLIIAQRLVRKSCLHPHDNKNLCEHCLQGYQGRTGIYELLPISHQTTPELLIQSDYLSLRHIGLMKVAAGVTTLTEINRVLNE